MLYRTCAYFLLAEHHTAQSLHNQPEASLSVSPPFHRNWPLTELLRLAACGLESWSNAESRRHNTHSAPREHPSLAWPAGGRAVSR